MPTHPDTPTTPTLDTRIMRRAMPFITASVRDPDQPGILKVWAEQGMPGLSLDLPDDTEEMVFHAGPMGPVFCRIDSRLAGLWYSDRAWWYLPDAILDDDLPSLDPIELTPAH